jgi:hypothetical protein
MEKSLSLSKTFNSKSLNRFVLWKKGYFTNRDSLPSLHIFEINVLLAKFFYYRNVLSRDNVKLFAFIHDIFKNYLEKYEVLEQSLKGMKDSANILILEEDLNKEFKEKNYREKQTSLLFMYDLLNEYICHQLIRIELDDFGYLPVFDQMIDVVIDYMPKSNVVGFSKFKCLKCLECQDCEQRVGKLKKHVDLEDFLKRLIKMKIQSK